MVVGERDLLGGGEGSMLSNSGDESAWLGATIPYNTAGAAKKEKREKVMTITYSVSKEFVAGNLTEI